jgi:glyoxylase-like metal-dependent hydrolase (beta-lactamase superfamily II)
MRFSDIREIVVTHIHPDHYGLAGRLREITDATLRFHRVEQLSVESRYANADELLGEMREWLRLNGVPPDHLDELSRASTSMLDRVQVAYPDGVLDGGEELICGDFTLRVIWTPGHSAGHVCLYEPRLKVLLSGDHVLPRISPAVGLHPRSLGNPLADYLDALQQVMRLDVRVVLPGHGEPFSDLAGRVDELLDHHAQRLDDVERLLASGAYSAYEVAQRMFWSQSRTWSDLPGYERRLAIMEALAHLEQLHARHRVVKSFTGGVAEFAPVTESSGGGPSDPRQLQRGRIAGRADLEMRW